MKSIILICITIVFLISCKNKQEDEYIIFDFENIKNELKREKNIDLTPISDAISESFKKRKDTLSPIWECACPQSWEKHLYLNAPRSITDSIMADSVIEDVVRIILDNVKQPTKNDSKKILEVKNRMDSLSVNTFYLRGVFLTIVPELFAQFTIENTNISNEEIS